MSEEVDPIKRTLVRIPRVVKKRGSLRWIGDLVASGISRPARALGRLARRMGIDFDGGANRRQVWPIAQLFPFWSKVRGEGVGGGKANSKSEKANRRKLVE